MSMVTSSHPLKSQKNDRGGSSVYKRSERPMEDSAMYCIGCGDDISVKGEVIIVCTTSYTSINIHQ